MNHPLAPPATSPYPRLEEGGLAEALLIYRDFESAILKDLRSTTTESEIIKLVRRLQGAHDFITYLENEVRAES